LRVRARQPLLSTLYTLLTSPWPRSILSGCPRLHDWCRQRDNACVAQRSDSNTPRRRSKAKDEPARSEANAKLRNSSRARHLTLPSGVSAIESERHWLSASHLEWPSPARHLPRRSRPDASRHLTSAETRGAVFRFPRLCSYTEHTCRHEPSFAQPQDQWTQNGSRDRW